MKERDKKKKKIDWAKKIQRAMFDADPPIRTAKELAELINKLSLKELGRKVTTANSVSRWLRSPERDPSEPKGTSLIFLIKALKADADYILFDESSDIRSRKSIERIAREIVKTEAQKVLKQGKNSLDDTVSKFLTSENIPQEIKNGILRQIADLLKMYEKVE